MPKVTKTNLTYAELTAELDEVLMALQSPDTDLDEAMRLYSRGLELLQLLEKHLKNAEIKIEKLKLQAPKS